MTVEQARALLLEKGLNITPQRVVITDYLLHTIEHPSADEVFEAVKERLPSCSRATVYNTLNTLTEAGIVRAFSPEPGKTRYDALPKPG
jgi:Fur family peroxide stress response transcriptional regulator